MGYSLIVEWRIGSRRATVKKNFDNSNIIETSNKEQGHMPVEMQTKDVVAALAALAHESRLSVFRLLVSVGPQGMSASKISEHLEVAPSSLSFHLKELLHAGLVTARQEGRFIYYAATYSRMNDLMAYLTDNCCGGNPCMPVRKTECSRHDIATDR